MESPSKKRKLSRSSRSQISIRAASSSLTFRPSEELPADANAAEIRSWLRERHFQKFTKFFANYTTAELLRLSRGDLTEICGKSQGIKLFNALRPSAPPPLRTLYFAIEGRGDSLWRIIHLHSLTRHELMIKLLATFYLPVDHLRYIQFLGPHGMRIFVNNELISQMKNESAFMVEALTDSSNDKYDLVLKRRIDSERRL